MVSAEGLDSSCGEAAELREQIEGLQRQLREQQTNTQAMWDLLIMLGSQLQLSSTSIKMAVSSLLDYDIFWDPSTSYEFLQGIDTSTDRTADLIVLLTLAFRSQAKSLEIRAEPQVLQEILETLKGSVDKRNFETRLIVGYPPEGKPALVDYQYLIVALRSLFEVVISESKGIEQLVMQASESSEYWQIGIGEIDVASVEVVRHFLKSPNDFKKYVGRLLPENTLKLIVACRILHLQKIELIQAPEEKAKSFSLSIPFAKSAAADS